MNFTTSKRRDLKAVANQLVRHIVDYGLDNVDTDALSFTKIDEDNLNKCCIEQPSLYVFWSVVYAEAQANLDKAEFELEVYEVEQDAKVRELNKDKKVTESAIKRAIQNTEEWKRLKLKAIEARKIAKTYQSIVRALEHRKDMLTTLSLNKRIELETNINIKEKQLEEYFNK